MPPAAAPGLAVVLGVSDHHGRAAPAAAIHSRALARDVDWGSGGLLPSQPLGIKRCIRKPTPKRVQGAGKPPAQAARVEAGGLERNAILKHFLHAWELIAQLHPGT